MQSWAEHFRAGGVFMWPIVVVSVMVLGLVIERVITLYFTAAADRAELLKILQKLISAGQLDRAQKLLAGNRSPVSKVLRAGLEGYETSPKVAQILMDEAALHELPRLEARTGYLAMLSNVATLAGLLGTIVGLIHSFAAVARADAATKSAKLADGISEAMNCTAFGLLVAIPALIMYAVLSSRAHHLADDVHQASIALYNFLIKAEVPRTDAKTKSEG
jgi:biopolymer transport protein ExbB